MIRIEVTDTFGGEANYSWVKRYEIEPIENETDSQLVKRAKKISGYTGIRCDKQNWGDQIRLTPRGIHHVIFITWG